MLVEDPKGTFRFEPEGEDGPCYFLRVPAHHEGARFDEEVAVAGGKQYGLSAIAAYIKRMVDKAWPDDPERLARVATLVATYQAGLAELGRRIDEGEFDDDDKALAEEWSRIATMPDELTELAEQIEAVDETFRRMLAKNATYRQVCGDVAARMFLAGWARVSVPFSRGPMGMSEALLAKIPPLHRLGMGDVIQARLRPTRQATKNFASRYGGEPTATTSSTTPTPPPTTH